MNTSTNDLIALGLEQSPVNKFLANFIDKMKHPTTANMSYEELIDLMCHSYEQTGTDASIVNVIRNLKSDQDTKQLWDDMHSMVTTGDPSLLSRPPQAGTSSKTAAQILHDTHFPTFDSLDDWSNYISGAGTSFGGWMSGGPDGILDTTNSVVRAALEKRFNPVNNYRRIRLYASQNILHRTNIPTPISGMNAESRLRGVETFNARSTEAFNARSHGARKASLALNKVSTAVKHATTGLRLAQGGIDLVSGVQQNNATRIAGGTIALTGAVVSISDTVAQKVSSSYNTAVARRAAGMGADLSSGAGKAAHFAPLVGGLISIASGVVSVVKNSQAADESFSNGNWGRGAMFTTMAVLDSAAIVVDAIGTVADLIPGIGTAVSVICDLVSTVIGLISDLIGAFTELVDTRSDDQKVQDAFNDYLQSAAFTNYIDELAETFKEQGFDVFDFMTDAEAAQVDADGVDVVSHNTKIEHVTRQLTAKVAGISEIMRRQVKLDATGQTNIIDGGDANDLLQVIRDNPYLGEATKTLRGLGGEDRIIGGNGPDTILGGAGSDKLYSNEGLDYLFGESGDDYLVPGTSAVTAVGGVGNDVVVLNGPNTHYDGGTLGTGSDSLVIPGTLVEENWPNHAGKYPARLELSYKSGLSLSARVTGIWPNSHNPNAYLQEFSSIDGFEKVHIDTKGRFANITLSQYLGEVGMLAKNTKTSIDFGETGASFSDNRFVHVDAGLNQGTHALSLTNLRNGVRGTLFDYAEDSTHTVRMTSGTGNVHFVFVNKNDHDSYNQYRNNQNVSVFKLGKVDAISLANPPRDTSGAHREFDLRSLSETSPNVIVSLRNSTVKLQENSFCNVFLALDALPAENSSVQLVFGKEKSNLLDFSNTSRYALEINTTDHNIKFRDTSNIYGTFNSVSNFAFGEGSHFLHSPAEPVNVKLNGGRHNVRAATFSTIASYAGEHHISLKDNSILEIAAAGDTIGKTHILDLEILKPITSDRLLLEDYTVKINGEVLTQNKNIVRRGMTADEGRWFDLHLKGSTPKMMRHDSDPDTLSQVKAGMLTPNNQHFRCYRDRGDIFSSSTGLFFTLADLETLTKPLEPDTSRYRNINRYNFKVMYHQKSENKVVLSVDSSEQASSTLKLTGVNSLSYFTSVYNSSTQTLYIYCRNPNSQEYAVSYNEPNTPLISYPIANVNLQGAIEAFCSHFNTVVIDQSGAGDDERVYDIEAFKLALLYLSDTHDLDLGLSSSLLPTLKNELPLRNTVSYFIDGVGLTNIFDSRVSHRHDVNVSGDREYIDLLSQDLHGVTCELDFRTSGKCIAWIDPSKDNQWNIYTSTVTSPQLTALVLSGVKPDQIRVTTSGSNTHVFNVNNTGRIYYHGNKPDVVYFFDEKIIFTGIDAGNQYTSNRIQTGGSQVILTNGHPNTQTINVFPENAVIEPNDHLMLPPPHYITLQNRDSRFSSSFVAGPPSSLRLASMSSTFIGLPRLTAGRGYMMTIKGSYTGRGIIKTIFTIYSPGKTSTYEGKVNAPLDTELRTDTITEFEFTANEHSRVLFINNVLRDLMISSITIRER